MKKIIGVMAVAMLLTAALIVPAAAEHPGPIEQSPEANETDYWEDFGADDHGEDDWVCEKYEPIDDPFVLDGTDLLDGNVWRLLVIKGGSGEDANELYWNPTSGDSYDHPVSGNSHAIACQRPEPEPDTHTVTFAKDWDGDEFDTSGVTVEFTVEVNGVEHDDNPFSPGDTLVVEEGDDVEVTEENVSDFVSETCDFTEGVPETLTDISDDATLTVTNTIDCEEFDVSYTKQWDGEISDEDLEGVTVTFDVSIDGADPVTLEDSETMTLDGEPADYDIELVGENVSGLELPEECSYESSQSIVDPANHDITVTNTVTCEDTFDLTLEKDWDVTDEDDLWDEDEASYTLLLNGDAFTGEPIEVTEGDEVEIGEEDVVVPDGCEFIGSDARTYTVDPEDADEDGLITLTLTNEVDCAEVEEEALQTITLDKIWDGEDFDGSDDVDVSFVVNIDGDEVTLADGETSEPFDADADWTFVSETVTGFPDDVCEYEAVVSEEDGTVTNTVDCEDPEPAAETEVLAESIEAEDDDEETLPRTGASTLLLSLLGLTALGSGGVILRRR